MFDGLDTLETHPQPFFVGVNDWPHFADRVRPHLQKMADGSGGRFWLDDIVNCICCGRFQLWLVLDGANIPCVMLTEIQQYPRLRELRIIGLVGHRPRRWLHLLHAVEASAKQNFGCARFACFSPRRMGTLLRTGGWREWHVLFEKELV